MILSEIRESRFVKSKSIESLVSLVGYGAKRGGSRDRRSGDLMVERRRPVSTLSGGLAPIQQVRGKEVRF